jgi:hypothetical protein
LAVLVQHASAFVIVADAVQHVGSQHSSQQAPPGQQSRQSGQQSCSEQQVCSWPLDCAALTGSAAGAGRAFVTALASATLTITNSAAKADPMSSLVRMLPPLSVNVVGLLRAWNSRVV